MRRMLLIAKRDYLAAVRTKAFLAGLVIAPLLFGGGFVGLALLRVKPDIRDRRIAVVDRTAAVAAAVVQAAREKSEKELFDKTTGRQAAPRYLFETRTAGAGEIDAVRLELSDRVRRGELYAFLEIGPEALHPGANADAKRIAYYTNAGGIDQVRSWLAGPVNDGLRLARLTELGIDPQRLRDLNAYSSLERMSLVSRDEKTGQVGGARKKGELEGFFVPYALSLLLAMMVMVGASPMLAAVTHDKTQRVVEMLLGAATPLELMGGKVLAAMGVSLTSSIVYVVGGVLTLSGLGMMGLLSPGILVWFFVYLLADMAMLCALAAALGALCSTPQDAQNLAIVVIAPVILPLFVLVVVLSQPSSLLATLLSLFPPFTPILMLVRQAMPAGVPAWQPWVGLVGGLGFAVAIVWAAARIFRIGIMLQGKPPKGGEILRWAIRG